VTLREEEQGASKIFQYLWRVPRRPQRLPDDAGEPRNDADVQPRIDEDFQHRIDEKERMECAAKVFSRILEELRNYRAAFAGPDHLEAGMAVAQVQAIHACLKLAVERFEEPQAEEDVISLGFPEQWSPVADDNLLSDRSLQLRVLLNIAFYQERPDLFENGQAYTMVRKLVHETIKDGRDDTVDLPFVRKVSKSISRALKSLYELGQGNEEADKAFEETTATYFRFCRLLQGNTVNADSFNRIKSSLERLPRRSTSEQPRLSDWTKARMDAVVEEFGREFVLEPAAEEERDGAEQQRSPQRDENWPDRRRNRAATMYPRDENSPANWERKRQRIDWCRIQYILQCPF
jgi:hypothetical protein